MKIARTAVAAAAFVALAVSANDRFASAAEEYLPDGYPKVIPAPGSKPPTVEEWNAVPREVTVKKSSAYHCETKMLREWFRATCFPYDSWTPKNVATLQQEGQQAFVGVFGTKASVVVQVIEAKTYSARFTWAPDNSTRDITVSFPRGGRPNIYFN